MNVGLDMRLVNTNTLEVADVISYQKQIVGRQVTAGVFDFLGTNFFDVSAGESALEPIQLAVRSVIERAVLEMVTRIYRAPAGACASPIGTAADPLADAADRPYPYAQHGLCLSGTALSVSAAPVSAALSVSAALQPGLRLQPGELQ